MKKKIVILGSTGSIGNKTLQIISKDKKNFDVIMLSTNSNIKILINQAKKFKVKHLIVSNKKAYQNIMRLKIAKKYNIYNNFLNFNKFIKKKIDYTMSAITGIEGLEPTSRLNKEEIFGPVVTLQPFEAESEAINVANDSDYGLSATIWTKDLKKAGRVSRSIEAGVIWVNCWLLRDLRTPFGGMKNSGYGREGGDYAMMFFTEQKNTCFQNEF